MPIALDCLCAGIVVADSVCHPLERIPLPGTLTRTERVELTIGGCSANVAVDMAKLGLRVGISGRVGDDVFGREVRDRLVAESVDCSGLVLSRTSSTSSTFVLNVKGEDRRFIHCVGANAEYDGMQVSPETIASTRVLYVGGFGLLEALTPECVIRMFRIAREAGVTTILNVVLPEFGDFSSQVKEVLPWSDYFFPNDDEARKLVGETDPARQIERLQQLGAKTVVVTCGSRGAYIATPTERLRSGIHPVEAIDATGTGDAFLSGFVYGMLNGADTNRCLQLGTAMGASCVRSMGATTGVFNSCELNDFVGTNPLHVESW
jgi:sugar/nucleoside kinase (ribokinase family)